MKLRLAVFLLSVLLSQKALANVVDNEIILLLDASGSLYDADYSRWNQMLALTQSIVDSTSGNSAIGIGTFSGCNPSYSPESCAQFVAGGSSVVGRLNMRWGLHDGAVDPFTGSVVAGDQSAGAVSSYVAGLGNSDFLHGHSWHDEAFYMALQSFNESTNTVLGGRYVFFLSDGLSSTSGHFPATADGYQSTTLQALKAMGVDINAITVGDRADVDFLTAITGDPNNLFDADDFIDFSSIVTPPTATPAPFSVALLALGLIGLLLRRR